MRMFKWSWGKPAQRQNNLDNRRIEELVDRTIETTKSSLSAWSTLSLEERWNAAQNYLQLSSVERDIETIKEIERVLKWKIDRGA